jgi:signal transduction histidine kinase
MTIKRKLILLLSALFLIIVSSIGLSGYFVNRLAENSRQIVQDNYRTLLYVQEMQQSLDLILALWDDHQRVTVEMERLWTTFEKQDANITETGEATLTLALEEHIREIQDQISQNKQTGTINDLATIAIFKAKSVLNSIFQLNEKAVEVRNQKAAQAADDAILYSSLFALTAILVTLFYIFRIPGYLIRPIQEISEQMESISTGNYNVSVNEDRKDEFRQMAIAFNAMIGRLQTFERSNMSKLLAERNRLNAVVEQFDIPILGISEKNNILFANDRMLQVLERRKENVIGHDVGSLAKANDLLRLLVRAESPDDDRQLFRVVLNGNERLFSKRTIVIDTELPDSTQLSHDRFIIMDDVTDFIQKDVRKTQFMATLSHELKTPVAAIEMSTDLLSSLKVGHLNEEQKGYVDKINEQTSRIRRMVNEILDLSKIEAGTIDFDMEPIGVGTLVEEAIQTVQPFLAYENIRIEKQVEENIPPIKVDSHKVLWTLNNFLTNAIRYTPKQGAITVSAFSRNGMVHIEVSDKGPGIKAKDQQRIFEKYVRLNKNEKGGTGLGLAISKEFIEAMGGEIGVRSHENEGATFWIRLKPQ